MSFGATIFATATAASAGALAGSNASIASAAAPVVRPVFRNVRLLSIDSSLIPPAMKVWLLAWLLRQVTDALFLKIAGAPGLAFDTCESAPNQRSIATTS